MASFKLSPAHPIAHGTALTMSTLGMIIGLSALHSPAEYARGFGLPSHSSSPVWLAVAGRKITVGVVLMTFCIQAKLREAGLCLMAGIITEGVDGYITAQHGLAERKWNHWGTAAVFGSFGAWLVFGME